MRLWGEPAFLLPWEGKVDAVAPGATYNIDLPRVDLSTAFLLELTERLAGLVHGEVRRGGEVLASAHERIEVLARDQWSGLRSLPEILAAFSVPNHPAIEQLLAQASRLLADRSGDGSLSGYQSRSRERVLRTAAAIYTALQRQGLSYVSPPASFEQAGQKIRLPDRMLAHRMGRCRAWSAPSTACVRS